MSKITFDNSAQAIAQKAGFDTSNQQVAKSLDADHNEKITTEEVRTGIKKADTSTDQVVSKEEQARFVADELGGTTRKSHPGESNLAKLAGEVAPGMLDHSGFSSKFGPQVAALDKLLDEFKKTTNPGDKLALLPKIETSLSEVKKGIETQAKDPSLAQFKSNKGTPNEIATKVSKQLTPMMEEFTKTVGGLKEELQLRADAQKQKTTFATHDQAIADVNKAGDVAKSLLDQSSKTEAQRKTAFNQSPKIDQSTIESYANQLKDLDKAEAQLGTVKGKIEQQEKSHPGIDLKSAKTQLATNDAALKSAKTQVTTSHEAAKEFQSARTQLAQSQKQREDALAKHKEGLSGKTELEQVQSEIQLRTGELQMLKASGGKVDEMEKSLTKFKAANPDLNVKPLEDEIKAYRGKLTSLTQEATTSLGKANDTASKLDAEANEKTKQQQATEARDKTKTEKAEAEFVGKFPNGIDLGHPALVKALSSLGPSEAEKFKELTKRVDQDGDGQISSEQELRALHQGINAKSRSGFDELGEFAKGTILEALAHGKTSADSKGAKEDLSSQLDSGVATTNAEALAAHKRLLSLDKPTFNAQMKAMNENGGKLLKEYLSELHEADPSKLAEFADKVGRFADKDTVNALYKGLDTASWGQLMAGYSEMGSDEQKRFANAFGGQDTLAAKNILEVLKARVNGTADTGKQIGAAMNAITTVADAAGAKLPPHIGKFIELYGKAVSEIPQALADRIVNDVKKKEQTSVGDPRFVLTASELGFDNTTALSLLQALKDAHNR